MKDTMYLFISFTGCQHEGSVGVTISKIHISTTEYNNINIMFGRRREKGVYKRVYKNMKLEVHGRF